MECLHLLSCYMLRCQHGSTRFYCGFGQTSCLPGTIYNYYPFNLLPLDMPFKWSHISSSKFYQKHMNIYVLEKQLYQL